MAQNNNITELMNTYLSPVTVIRQPSIQSIFPLIIPHTPYTYYIPFGLYDNTKQGFKFKINKTCNLKCGVLLSNGKTVTTDDFDCPENTEIIFNNEGGASGGNSVSSSIINVDNNNTTFATPFITFNRTQTQTQITDISFYVDSQ